MKYLSSIIIILMMVTACNADTATYYFNSLGAYSYDDDTAGGFGVANIVDNNDGTSGRDNNNGHYVTLDENTCTGENLGTITAVGIQYLSSSNAVITSIYNQMTPYFGGSTAGSNYNQTQRFAEGSQNWSEVFNITSDGNAPGSWTWTDVKNLDVLFTTVRPVTGRVNIFTVNIVVTYTPPLVPVFETPISGNGSIGGSGSIDFQ